VSNIPGYDGRVQILDDLAKTAAAEIRATAAPRAARIRATSETPRCDPDSGQVSHHLLLLGAAVALISARQFRQVVKNLDPAVVPPGYWTQVGVALNVAIAVIALIFAMRFAWPGR